LTLTGTASGTKGITSGAHVELKINGVSLADGATNKQIIKTVDDGVVELSGLIAGLSSSKLLIDSAKLPTFVANTVVRNVAFNKVTTINSVAGVVFEDVDITANVTLTVSSATAKLTNLTTSGSITVSAVDGVEFDNLVLNGSTAAIAIGGDTLINGLSKPTADAATVTIANGKTLTLDGEITGNDDNTLLIFTQANNGTGKIILAGEIELSTIAQVGTGVFDVTIQVGGKVATATVTSSTEDTGAVRFILERVAAVTALATADIPEIGTITTGARVNTEAYTGANSWAVFNNAETPVIIPAS
jgi:hypothetical protein